MNFSAVLEVVTCVFTWQHTALRLILTPAFNLHCRLIKLMFIITYPLISLIMLWVTWLLVCTITGLRSHSTLQASWSGTTTTWQTLHRDNCSRAWERVCDCSDIQFPFYPDSPPARLDFRPFLDFGLHSSPSRDFRGGSLPLFPNSGW